MQIISLSIHVIGLRLYKANTWCGVNHVISCYDGTVCNSWGNLVQLFQLQVSSLVRRCDELQRGSDKISAKHSLVHHFFPRVILLCLYREPQPKKTQKAPHHRPQTPTPKPQTTTKEPK